MRYYNNQLVLFHACHASFTILYASLHVSTIHSNAYYRQYQTTVKLLWFHFFVFPCCYIAFHVGIIFSCCYNALHVIIYSIQATVVIILFCISMLLLIVMSINPM
jgi:hypothetical protein